MKRVTREEHATIISECKIQDTEDYAVLTHVIHGTLYRSIHVFKRLPSTTEMADYENKTSKVKFRGKVGEVEGGVIQASDVLYNKIIDRVFDCPIGRRVVPSMTTEVAMRDVPVMIKRQALRDLIGEVYSESQVAEQEDELKENSKSPATD